jgi:hypothetical protein
MTCDLLSSGMSPTLADLAAPVAREIKRFGYI